MNINNYNHSNYNSFGIIPPGKDKCTVNSDNEKMDIYIKKSAEALLNRVEKEVPENGKFKGISTSFRIPGTKNFAILLVEYDEVDPKNKRYLSTNIQREYTDKLYSKPLITGTKKEVMKYLKNFIDSNQLQEEYKQGLNKLSYSVDEDFR